jgi:hypothetical protein
MRKEREGHKGKGEIQILYLGREKTKWKCSISNQCNVLTNLFQRNYLCGNGNMQILFGKHVKIFSFVQILVMPVGNGGHRH